jgi:hypothetical protein
VRCGQLTGGKLLGVTVQLAIEHVTGWLVVRFERHAILLPTGSFGGGQRRWLAFGGSCEQARDSGELQDRKHGVGGSHHPERAAHGLELPEIFHQHANAR